MSSSQRRRSSTAPVYSDVPVPGRPGPGPHHSNRPISALGPRALAAVTRAKASKPGRRTSSCLRPPSERGANVQNNRVRVNANELKKQAQHLFKQSTDLRGQLMSREFNLNLARRNIALMQKRIHQLEEELDDKELEKATRMKEQMMQQTSTSTAAQKKKSPRAYMKYLYTLATFLSLITVYIASAPRNNYNHSRSLPPT